MRREDDPWFLTDYWNLLLEIFVGFLLEVIGEYNKVRIKLSWHSQSFLIGLDFKA